MTSARAKLKIGFVPLSDAAPIIVAQEKGFFAEQGLDVELSHENSWSSIRDKLAGGMLDAAHMLAPMAPASWLDNAYAREPFVTAICLSLNGNAITVSEELYREMVEADPEAMFERPTTARALKQVIARRMHTKGETVSFGSVFPYSSHYYAIRYWLASAGIDPDRDVRMVVAPPPLVVKQLEEGMIDAFCVGEPWNSLAEYRGTGRAIVRSSEIWRHMPEKILGVRAKWAQENFETHLALVRAVLSACIWLDERKNRLESAHILSKPHYVGVPAHVLAASLAGEPLLDARRSVLQSNDALIFHHYAANFPWRSHALWFLSQMQRWGQANAVEKFERIAEQAYHPEVYRAAAEQFGVSAPLIDKKVEGIHDRSWVLDGTSGPIAMSSSSFIDGAGFDSDRLGDYVKDYAPISERGLTLVSG